MLGNIVKWVAGPIALLVIGWTAGQMFENWVFFNLDSSISIADVLAIIVDILLALIIAVFIEKSLQDSRIEKDFLIKEIDNASEILTDLEKICANETTLSLSKTIYDISRARKILLAVWKTLEELKPDYCNKHKENKTAILTGLKILNSWLTDVKSYETKTGIEPIKINKGHIYLNGTVKPEIDNCIADIKDRLLRLKISINKI